VKRIFIYILFAGAATWISCGGSPRQSLSSEQNRRSTNTKALTKADFLKTVFDYEANPEEWKYLGDKPAIIDFWADWCAPCKALSPILEELAAEYEDIIYIYKVNTDKERELAAAFGIQAIPSLLFIPMDDLPQMARGALPKKELKELIDEFLLKKE